jgi:hypothetical protein
VGGFLTAAALGLTMLQAVLCGAALTATSIGISARVLSDLGQLQTPEGRVILGAAVFDDIVGLIILSVISGLAGGEELSFAGVLWKTVVAFGFIAAARVHGRLLVPPLFRLIERIKVAGTLGVFGLAFAFALAWLAEMAGSALIIGAFAAGVVMHQTPQRGLVQRATTEIGHFFVPVFFAFVGASVDVRRSRAPTSCCRRCAHRGRGRGQIPVRLRRVVVRWRQAGGRRGYDSARRSRAHLRADGSQPGIVLTVPLFSALTLMVMVTTFIAPPLLKHLAVRRRRTREAVREWRR